MKRTSTFLLFLLAVIGAPCVPAAESPDAKVNLQSGLIELAEPVWTDGNYDIRYIVSPGERSEQVSDVATHSADDLRPRMAIAPDGDAYVVWWRDVATPQTLIRRHNHSDGSWSAESVLSGATLPGRDPHIVHDGSDVWVVFAEEASTERRIRIGAIEDEPDPFGIFSEIASTDHDGDLELELHAVSGHLWVTWNDSDTYVAWTEYDYTSQTWGSVDYDSYASDSTKHARERIHDTVVGN